MTERTQATLIDTSVRDANIDRMKRELGIQRSLRTLEMALARLVFEAFPAAGIPYARLHKYNDDLGTWFGLGETSGHAGTLGLGLVEGQLVLRVVGGEASLVEPRMARMTSGDLAVATGAHVGHTQYDWPGPGWVSVTNEAASVQIAKLLATIPYKEGS
jgi:hypothetical protein